MTRDKNIEELRGESQTVTCAECGAEIPKAETFLRKKGFCAECWHNRKDTE